MRNAPREMLGRPIDHRGFYVPWFVTRKDENGHWDFQGLESSRVQDAHRRNVCFISGTPLGRHITFAIGPMCTINRVSGEWGGKRNVVEWSIKVCPFLSRPLAKRPDMTGPEGHVTPGIMFPENPGILALWSCYTHDVRRNYHGLFELGEPTDFSFWVKGERATKEQVAEAMERAYTKLHDINEKYEEGSMREIAERELYRQAERQRNLMVKFDLV